MKAAPNVAAVNCKTQKADILKTNPSDDSNAQVTSQSTKAAIQQVVMHTTKSFTDVY